jgi:hypothetical protein
VPAIEITPDEAALDIYDLSGDAFEMVADGYHSLTGVTNWMSEKADTAFGRLTGLAYHAKSIDAMFGAFEKVDTSHVVDIIKDPDRSLWDKVSDTSSYVADNFSYDSLSAGLLYFGKAAAIGLFAACIAPVAGVAAAAVATTGLTAGAMYFLSTDAGHSMEAAAGDKIKAGIDFLRGVRRADSGEDPEYGQMAKIGEKMHDIGKEMHGHDAHHKSFGETLKHDVVAAISIHKYPGYIYDFMKDILGDSEKLHDGMEAKHGTHAPAAPHEDRIAEIKQNAAAMTAPAGQQPEGMTRIVPSVTMKVGA